MENNGHLLFFYGIKIIAVDLMAIYNKDPISWPSCIANKTKMAVTYEI